MLVVVALIILLGLAEASCKTPRTASPNSTSSPTTILSTTSIPSASSTSGVSLVPSATVTNADIDDDDDDDALPDSTSGTDGPKITTSPELELGGNFHELGGAKFVQTTYWSCVKFPLETHCGWHEPILDAGAARVGCEGGRMAMRAGIVAGVVGGLVLGG